MNSITARAHTNIALVKYWGKKDPVLRIPTAGSLSLTLDQFYTDTTVEIAENNSFSINNELLDNKSASRLINFLKYFKEKYRVTDNFKIDSINHVPTSAGLASSASAYAALSAGLAKAAKLNLDETELSRLARVGSGSASRSIFGGFVEWHAGNDDLSSYSEQIMPEEEIKDLSIISVIINDEKKDINSTKGMKISQGTSPYYDEWPKVVNHDLKLIKAAIADKDFTTVGEITEQNAMSMHALTMSSNPPFLYFSPSTIRIISSVQELRKQGIECYYTIDAGPNVKILCQNNNIEKIQSYLKENISNIKEQLVCSPGSGIEYIFRK